MPVLSKRIVLDCFYLLIFYFDKFSTDVCRLPYTVNVNLNLSNKILHPTKTALFDSWLRLLFKISEVSIIMVCFLVK